MAGARSDRYGQVAGAPRGGRQALSWPAARYRLSVVAEVAWLLLTKSSVLLVAFAARISGALLCVGETASLCDYSPMYSTSAV